jgi:hypothetical protein
MVSRWLIGPEIEAIEVAERFADGRATAEELAKATYGPMQVLTTDIQCIRATSAISGVTHPEAHWAAYEAIAGACEFTHETEGKVAADAVELRWTPDAVRLFRDVFGNPFRPVTPGPSWLSWNDGTMPKMAQAIYDERAFDRLPILADALEDAGCTDAAILDHCRGGGEHVRGCWVVDLLLGKE